MTAQDLVTYKEASVLLGISERSIMRLVARKKLVTISLTGNGCMRIVRASIDLYLQELHTAASRQILPGTD